MHSTKAPGLGRFNALFFQNVWDTIGDDLSLMNNSTVITLILKINDPKSMKDFRPIILFNVTYKIIARAITNKFWEVLGLMIDPNQSALSPGWFITNNILIGYEYMH